MGGDGQARRSRLVDLGTDRRRTSPAWQAQAYAHAARGLVRPPGPTPFVILAQGRSGSGLLTQLLDSVEGVRCQGEILTQSVAWPAAYCEGRRRLFPTRHYGFKVKIDQLLQRQRIDDPGAWLRRMHGRGWTVVHLHRANLARQAVSTLVWQQTRVAHRRGDDPTPDHRHHLDPDALVAAVERRVVLGELDAEALDGLPHVRLVYEADLLHAASHPEAVGRVTAALRVPLAAAPSSSFVRTSDDDLSTTISNLDELRDALAGTPWSSMLDPGWPGLG